MQPLKMGDSQLDNAAYKYHMLAFLICGNSVIRGYTETVTQPPFAKSLFMNNDPEVGCN